MSSIAITGGATGTGVFSLLAPSTSTNRTLTLPDSNGTILTTATAGVPVNGPAFSAYLNASQSVTGSTFTKVTLDTEEFDTNTNFASSRFTPTVSGYYQINGAINISGTSPSGGMVSIYKNGSEYKRGTMIFTTFTNVMVGNVSSVVYFNGSTDYVELYGYVAAASGFSFGSGLALTYFSGAMVRAA